MARDSSGVYSLPAGYLAETGETILASQHNPPLEDIAAALTGSVPTSGSKAMTGPLRVPDGTAGQPALAFASDPTAGFYYDGTSIKATKPVAGIIPIGLGPLPWTGQTPPSGWVLCYGQNLSRAFYADLWVLAQAEIAAGSPLYNNGNGSTTFGIVDMRGRVAAGYDLMGGVPAFLLTGAYGVGLGAESHTLTTAQIPQHIHPNTISVASHRHGYGPQTISATAQSGSGVGGLWSGSISTSLDTSDTTVGVSISNVVNVGGGSSHPIIQPTMPMSLIIYAGA